MILSSQTSATDVLKAMGAMPSGFRSTTLGKMAKEGKLLAIYIQFRNIILVINYEIFCSMLIVLGIW